MEEEENQANLESDSSTISGRENILGRVGLHSGEKLSPEESVGKQ